MHARTSVEMKVWIEAARLAGSKLENETHLLPLFLFVPAAEFYAASIAVCPLELKCSATGKPGALLLILRRCSPKHPLRVCPVSPRRTQCTLQVEECCNTRLPRHHQCIDYIVEAHKRCTVDWFAPRQTLRKGMRSLGPFYCHGNSSHLMVKFVLERESVEGKYQLS